jgi:hypothetical protein
MSKIFISYRREDSADATGRIYDRLVAKFGKSDVFKDVENIPAGANYQRYLQEAVNRAMVIVIIIGKHWIDIEENGQRRLIRPNDPVRIEIETALARKDNVLILPLFVQGAQMPRVGRGQLPASIAELSYINGVEVRSDPYFHDDMDRVITIISDFLGHPTPRKVATPPSPQASEPANSPHAQPLLSSAYQMAEAQPAISAPQSPMNRPPDRVVGMSFNDAPTLATRSVGSYPYPYMPSSLTQAAPRNDSTAFKVITFGSGFSALAFLASFIVLAATSLNTAPSAVAAFLGSVCKAW